jgi:hypothetical protein
MLVRVTAEASSNTARSQAPIAEGVDDEAEDQRLEQSHAVNDEKERAEHVMLVDLGRNDLGRVSEYGSVKVRDLMYVERYSHVMHLVSALESKLRQRPRCSLDAFRRLFSLRERLSGAPKVRAMQIIEELEPTRRGIYGGIGAVCGFRRESGFLHRHSHHPDEGKKAHICKRAQELSPIRIRPANFRNQSIRRKLCSEQWRWRGTRARGQGPVASYFGSSLIVDSSTI